MLYVLRCLPIPLGMRDTDAERAWTVVELPGVDRSGHCHLLTLTLTYNNCSIDDLQVRCTRLHDGELVISDSHANNSQTWRLCNHDEATTGDVQYLNCTVETLTPFRECQDIDALPVFRVVVERFAGDDGEWSRISRRIWYFSEWFLIGV